MRRSVFFWLIALLLPVLHFLLYVGLGIGPWAPDLLTISLLLVAREVRSGTAAGLGFGFGLLEDAFSILSFGANAVALTLVGILGARSRNFFVGETLLFLVSYLVLGTWLRFALHWVFAGELVREAGGRLLFLEAPVEALYAAGIGVLILLISGAWSRKVY